MSKLMARRRGRQTPDASLATDNMTDQPRDVGEFSEIAKKHEAYLYATAVRLCGDPDLARDLVQDTFARALPRFHRFRQGTNARAWLATILTRLFLDRVKHEKVVSRAEKRLGTEEGVEGEGDVDILIPSVPDAALWDAVEKLEPDLRTVVELRYREQLSYKEIADRLRLQVGTVGTRLRRAHERLRDLLKSRTS